MGSLDGFYCVKCKYEATHLERGPGMNPEEYHPVLCVCRQCKELLSINLHDKRKRCPTCRGPAEELGREDRVPCPRCGEILQGRIMGWWD